MTRIVSDVSLADMIQCAARELGMRRGVYPKWVASGKMKQAIADEELLRMEAIYLRLKSEQGG